MGAAPTASVDVRLTHLRSERGTILLCLTADAKRFPGCVGDPAAVTRTVPATQHALRITGLSRGDYALSVIHDENGNAKLDTFAGIPREGFGFSRNPGIGFGPPRFSAAAFPLGASDAAEQQVRIRYLL